MRRVCEVFISKGISLPSLIPSLGSPSLISAHSDRTSVLRGTQSTWVHPTPAHSVTRRGLHTLKRSRKSPPLARCAALTRTHTNTHKCIAVLSKKAARGATCTLWLRKRSEGCCRRALVVALCRVLSEALYEEDSLEMRGPLT